MQSNPFSAQNKDVFLGSENSVHTTRLLEKSLHPRLKSSVYTLQKV